ncbi:MAG: DNA polymerase/3'-5' exonuclease PolX, partial [Chitinophagia bacterium]|nr:DNA polymerase/3'-5' exonuclease PolX [Chitinophagia bacterium]
MHNYEIAEQFTLLGKLMDIHGENPFKIKSYTNAAYTLDKLAEPVSEMSPHELFAIKGIGEAIGQKILQLIENKRLTILEDYIEKTPIGILEMLKIKGLGPKKIITIWKELEIETVGELLYACQENRLINYKGFGAKTQQNIQESLEYYLQHQGSYLYEQVETLACSLQNSLYEKFPENEHIISGHFKRQMETIDFLDVVTTLSENKLINWLTEKEFTITKLDEFISCKGVDNFEIRWHITSPENFYWTDFTLASSPNFLKKWVENPFFKKNF